jgi:hypothetical protein
MNSEFTSLPLPPWPAFDARSIYCSVSGCGQVAVCGVYCEDCYFEIAAFEKAFEEKKAARLARQQADAGKSYMAIAIEAAARNEWVGLLGIIAIAMAMILIEFLPWLRELVRMWWF